MRFQDLIAAVEGDDGFSFESAAPGALNALANVPAPLSFARLPANAFSSTTQQVFNGGGLGGNPNREQPATPRMATTWNVNPELFGEGNQGQFGALQSKYNSVDDLGDGRFEAVFQQPGGHKYDLMRLLYDTDPATGELVLQGTPTNFKQQSSNSQVGQALGTMASFIGSAAFAPGLAGALGKVGAGAVLGGAAPLLSGGNSQDAIRGALSGAIAGSFAPGASGAESVGTPGASLVANQSAPSFSDTLLRAAGQTGRDALLQGALAEVSGGKFSDGAKAGLAMGAVRPVAGLAGNLAAGASSGLGPIASGALGQLASSAAAGALTGNFDARSILGNALGSYTAGATSEALGGGQFGDFAGRVAGGTLGQVAGRGADVNDALRGSTQSALMRAIMSPQNTAASSRPVTAGLAAGFESGDLEPIDSGGYWGSGSLDEGSDDMGALQSLLGGAPIDYGVPSGNFFGGPLDFNQAPNVGYQPTDFQALFESLRSPVASQPAAPNFESLFSGPGPSLTGEALGGPELSANYGFEGLGNFDPGELESLFASPGIGLTGTSLLGSAAPPDVQAPTFSNAGPGFTPGSLGQEPTQSSSTNPFLSGLNNVFTGITGALNSLGQGIQNLRPQGQGLQNANNIIGVLGLLSALQASRNGGRSNVSPAELRAMVPAQDSAMTAAQRSAMDRFIAAPLTQPRMPTGDESRRRYGVDLANPGYAEGGGVGALGRISSDLAEFAGHAGSGYVAAGEGGGQDDMVDAKLSPGEYVFDADVVSALGDGSNEEGARRLDEMRERIRSHKRSAPADRIPPKARGALSYLK